MDFALTEERQGSMHVKLSIESGIATVTLDRPEKMNALNEEMYLEMARIFAVLQTDDSVRAVILTGVPGAELASAAQALAGELADSATYAIGLAKRMFQSMYTPSLEALLETEILTSTIARLTDDHKEGIAAFAEKRGRSSKGDDVSPHPNPLPVYGARAGLSPSPWHRERVGVRVKPAPVPRKWGEEPVNSRAGEEPG